MAVNPVNKGAVGERVRYWRQRRNLDRKRFADMVGRSTSWLDKIEKGERGLDRLPMIERVAAALSIDPAVLIDAGASASAAQCVDAVEVQAIREALGRYRILGPGREVVSTETGDRVRKQLDYAGHAWLSSHFTVVGRVLPGLLRDAQALASQTGDADVEAHQQAQRALVMAYRLACSMLLKYGSTDIAWLAADRALHTAGSSEDIVAMARATRSAARAMSQTGQLSASVAAAVGMADLMRSQLGRTDPDIVPLFGMLLLSAAITAAKQGDSDLARSLHEEALGAQTRLGAADHRHHTVFGLANIEVHRVAAFVRLRDGAAAVRYAEGIDAALIAELPRNAARTSCSTSPTPTHRSGVIDLLSNSSSPRSRSRPRRSGVGRSRTGSSPDCSRPGPAARIPSSGGSRAGPG